MALGCVQCPLNSNVIGTNYDGTTAGKIRLGAGMAFSPRYCASFFAGGASAVACRIGWPAATTERVVVNRYTGLAIEGFDPVAYFTDGGGPGVGRLRGARGRRRLALSQRGQPRVFRRRIPKSTGPNSAATTRSIWRAA